MHVNTVPDVETQHPLAEQSASEGLRTFAKMRRLRIPRG